MYAGRIVEDLPAARSSAAARHPYTRALLAAVPDMETDLGKPLATVPGRPVDPAHVPAGCAFAAALPARRRALPRGRAAARDGCRGQPSRVLARRRAAAR